MAASLPMMLQPPSYVDLVLLLEIGFPATVGVICACAPLPLWPCCMPVWGVHCGHRAARSFVTLAASARSW